MTGRWQSVGRRTSPPPTSLSSRAEPHKTKTSDVLRQRIGANRKGCLCAVAVPRPAAIATNKLAGIPARAARYSPSRRGGSDEADRHNGRPPAAPREVGRPARPDPTLRWKYATTARWPCADRSSSRQCREDRRRQARRSSLSRFPPRCERRPDQDIGVQRGASPSNILASSKFRAVGRRRARSPKCSAKNKIARRRKSTVPIIGRSSGMPLSPAATMPRPALFRRRRRRQRLALLRFFTRRRLVATSLQRYGNHAM
jgi:hypothetical protein